MMNLADPLFLIISLSLNMSSRTENFVPSLSPSLSLFTLTAGFFSSLKFAVFSRRSACCLSFAPRTFLTAITFFCLLFISVRLFSVRDGERGGNSRVGFSFGQLFFPRASAHVWSLFLSERRWIESRVSVFDVWMWTSVLGWADLDWGLCAPVSTILKASLIHWALLSLSTCTHLLWLLLLYISLYLSSPLVCQMAHCGPCSAQGFCLLEEVLACNCCQVFAIQTTIKMKSSADPHEITHMWPHL